MIDKANGRHAAIAVLVALACIVFAPFSALAADPVAEAPAVVLPQTLTRESARDLLSRLSDQQVRGLLLEQLDRAAQPSAGTTATTGVVAKDGMSRMAGMAGMVEKNAGTVRQRLNALRDAFIAFPSSLRDAGRRLTMSPTGSDTGLAEIWLQAGHIAAMLVVGWIAQRVYVHALRKFRANLMRTPARTFFARAFQLAVGLLLDLAALVVFALAALAIFLTFQHGHDLWRITLLAMLIVLIGVRVVALFVRFLLGHSGEQGRLLPFADAPARLLRRYVMALTIIFGVMLVILTVLTANGATAVTLDVLRIIGWVIGLALTLSTVWRVRRPIANMIRGDGHPGAIRAWIADLWPVVATAYFLVLFVGSMSDILAGTPGPVGVGILSVLIVVALPIVDLALCRALASAAAPEPTTGSGTPVTGFIGAYEAIFRRAIHIVIVVAGMLMLARLWQLRLFDFAQNSFGGKVASSLLGVGIVLLAAYLAWEIAKTAIDRRVRAEGEQKSDVPSTRLRTVLPILRATILVTIGVMAAMSILAALGFDILPLLAGASIVGVAIGFGSQTLVKDIVSGAFFLMDDAFRLGEYIEVGDAKGRVEKINLRSVFLRHHRGALNVLPYGEIHRMRNTSRDWMVHVMEFRLTYDTNMLQVKKIMKKIGEEMAADPDYAPDILQPLKSAGVMAAEDSAVVVRAKFTSRPTNNAWVVRRISFDRIIREFREAGITFAHRQVTVNVPPGHDGDAVAGAAAATAAETRGARAS